MALSLARPVASICSVVLLAVSAGLMAAACGGPAPETLCKRLCDCGACADGEQEDCADSLGDAEKEASDQECGAEYDAYVSCLDEELECKNGGADVSGCDDEHDKLVACLGEPVVLLAGNGCIDFCVELATCAGVDPANCQVENPCTTEQNRCAACLAGGTGDLCSSEGLVAAAFPCIGECLGATACEVGSTIECQCADGASGTATCNGAVFGPCECAVPK
jgi:hypothetical protein